MLGLTLFFMLFGGGQGNAEGRYSYQLFITGLEGAGLAETRQIINEGSLLKKSQGAGFSSVSNLRSKVKADVDLARTALRSQGFYSSLVTSRITRQDNDFEVRIAATPGERYLFGEISYSFQGLQPAPSLLQEIADAAGLKAGTPAVAARFLTAETAVGRILPEIGFPFAKPVEHDLVVDHQSRTLNVMFLLDVGSRQRMGQVRFTGQQDINTSYLERLIDWGEADFYRKSHVDGLRERLLQTNLFARTELTPVPADDNRTDINVSLKEAAHRTIGTTAGYSTAEGLGADIFWEHRNMFSRGGVLRVTTRAAEIEQSLSGRLELPNFARLNQTLSFEGTALRQDTDAFLSYEAEFRAGLDRVLTDTLAVSGGAVIEYSDITDAEGDRDFLLVSAPLGMRWDSSDDLLNPSKGVRASLVVTPASNLSSNGFSFVRSELRSSAYFVLNSTQDFIFALRGRLGGTSGASSRTLPATHRFYAGGGGSIRGYSFQNVGPLDNDNDPLGGRSVAEIAAELRFNVSKSVGLVPFLEGGNVYDNSLPTFSHFRWGAGVGARYYTSFGPLRFDVAIPLNRRVGEKHVQFYISLGQAF